MSDSNRKLTLLDSFGRRNAKVFLGYAIISTLGIASFVYARQNVLDKRTQNMKLNKSIYSSENSKYPTRFELLRQEKEREKEELLKQQQQQQQK
jgi:hypothetical protein